MEIDKISFFDYKINNKKISISNLNKLFFETFTSLKAIHDSGYYHGELGDENSRLLVGNLNYWSKVIIKINEKNKITNQSQLDDDIETLSYMIFQIIVDNNIYEIKDKNKEIITPGHEKFIKIVKCSIKKYSNYKKHLELLLWIFKIKPHIINIINRINIDL